jgi:hypothetical protein
LAAAEIFCDFFIAFFCSPCYETLKTAMKKSCKTIEGGGKKNGGKKSHIFPGFTPEPVLAAPTHGGPFGGDHQL